MRTQKGTLRVEERKSGETWVLRYLVTRPSDGKRVENTKVIGLLADFPTEKTAWAQVERLSLKINDPDFTSKVTFQALADLYIKAELQPDSRMAKKSTTREDYNRVLAKRLIPRWGKFNALKIEPIEIEDWLDSLALEEELENTTLGKFRKVMKQVYKTAQKLNKFPRDKRNPLDFVKQSVTTAYEAITVSLEVAFQILGHMRHPEKTLALLVAATGLRISEALGLKWHDVDYLSGRIYVRRRYINGVVEEPKSYASRKPVVMHKVLAAFMLEWQTLTPWSKPDDWIFASERLDGKLPRRANMLVADHLRPAAVLAGVPELLTGEKVRFGFHNLRHSLASFLVDANVDPKTVQAMLRHSNVKTTLELYAHAKEDTKMKAQGMALERLVPQGIPQTEAIQ